MRTAVGFAWVLVVALGCGGSALSRSAASKGAQDFLEESGPYCLLVGLQTSAPPWVVSEGDPALSRLQSFEQLGLVSSRETTLEEKGFTGVGVSVRQVPALELSLTEEGRAALVKRSALGLDQYLFRYASAEVAEVVEWTEPAAGLGQVVSRVRFKARPAAIPAWAKGASFARLFPEEAARLAGEPMTLTAGLVKTSKGWRPAISTLSP